MSDHHPHTPGLPAHDGSTDPSLHLEDIAGQDALEWVREHNVRTSEELNAAGEVTALAAGL